MLLRTWLADIHHAAQESIWDRLLRRQRCPVLPSFLIDPVVANRPVLQEMDDIFRIVVGRRLTCHIVGTDHPRRHSLTDFIERGAVDAQRVLPYVRPQERLLEYGGGVGRIGRSIAPHVHQLVSVDTNPLMKEYGPRLSQGIDFRNLGELSESPEFDGAYSIAVFFHLTLDQQKAALEYIHHRLKPGGWFLVDLKIGQRTTGPRRKYGNLGYTALEDFRALYEPLFAATPVPLFYSGFLMEKK